MARAASPNSRSPIRSSRCKGRGPPTRQASSFTSTRRAAKQVVFSFNARDIDGSSDNAAQQIAVQYRIGESGAWTNLPAGYIADATTGPSLATQSTAVTVTLPTSVDGQSQLQVRVITSNAVGNDEWVGIDDILVTSQPAATVPVLQHGALAIASASIVEGNDGVAHMQFTVTRTGGTDGITRSTSTAPLRPPTSPLPF